MPESLAHISAQSARSRKAPLAAVAPATPGDRWLAWTLLGVGLPWLAYTRLYFFLHPRHLTFDGGLFMWYFNKPDPFCGGTRVSLADFRGRPVLINFWATYCAPCRREMPLIERTAAQHPGLVVLLIDERDSHQSASAFVNELQITSTVLFDGDGKVGDAYRISGLPTTFFIRTDGAIEGRYIGETNAGILGPHIGAIGA